MKEFLNSLFKDFSSYFDHIKSTIGSFEFWIYPLITILLIGLCTIVFTKILYNNKNIYKHKKIYYIHHAWIISSFIIATIIIGMIIFLFLKRFYTNREVDLRLSHLISLIICFIFAIIAFASLSKHYRQESIKDITILPLTPSQENRYVLRAKRSFLGTKIWILLPVIGFIFLSLNLINSDNLISIVLDTSNSMYPNEIDKGRSALIETFNGLNSNTTIVFTTLKSSSDYYYYNDILKFTLENSDSLNAITLILDPISAIEHVQTIGDNPEQYKSNGTWLTEAIWQNFLYTKNEIETNTNKKYKDKILIIITDCKEEVMSDAPEPLTEIEEFKKIFQPENIYVIDLRDGENSNSLFYQVLIDRCGVQNFPGSTKDDYKFALMSALPSIKGKLIVWILIFYIVTAIIILLIKPAKLR